MLLLLPVILLQAYVAFANTEKAIFLGPPSLQIPTKHPTLEDLKLEVLSPQQLSLRTHTNTEFPTNTSENGISTWMVLNRLQEGQRYEVRICWAATEPTSFRLETYTLPTVFESPELIKSLAKYSESRQLSLIKSQDQKHQGPKHTYVGVSTLFLRIQAAADYYTMNQTLMDDVPPVFVDIILDPYVFNAVPQSLLPTAVYVIVLAIGGWYLSKAVNGWISAMAKKNVGVVKKNT